MINPYRNIISTEYSNRPATKIRWQKTLEFIGENRNFNSAIDIGDRTGLTDLMEKKFGINFDNTLVDLDVGELTGEYDLVTSFEVLEHLFNPLFNLKQIHKILNPEGSLFLSTPLAKPRLLWAEKHFHEMSKKSINVLFEKAGFKIIHQRDFRVHPFLFYTKGFRPLMRLFLDKIQIYELVKGNS
jgi:SAM-dependent methyltransferase|tara:strand:- start:708 stop:1262 length:555 start_codon:yes stop_codon:yes gene_type:complete